MYGGFQEECKSISWFENLGGHYSRRLFLLTLYFSLSFSFSSSSTYLPLCISLFSEQRNRWSAPRSRNLGARSTAPCSMTKRGSEWISTSGKERKRLLTPRGGKEEASCIHFLLFVAHFRQILYHYNAYHHIIDAIFRNLSTRFTSCNNRETSEREREREMPKKNSDYCEIDIFCRILRK